jgi:hypothetical protein
MAAEQRVERRPGAFERNVQDIDAGHSLEQLR